MDGDLKNIIFSLLDDDSKTLVFTSEIVARSWLRKYTIDNNGKTVFTERAISWDKFKTQFVHPGNLKQVSNIDRQLFASDFVRKNYENLNFFSSKYSESMQPFAMAIAGYLPFFAYKDEKSSAAIHDIDLITAAYKEYLREHSLFEYNFLEKDFSFLNKDFVLVFPETFNDPIVDEISGKCTVVSTKSISKKDLRITECENSLSEIRSTVRDIYRNLENGMDPNSIAVTCACIDSYRPYLEEEADKFGIKLCFTSSRKLTSCAQGNLFRDLYRVKDEDFSFESVKKLLLNPAYPFKNISANRALIQDAIKYRLKKAKPEQWLEVLEEDSRNLFERLYEKTEAVFAGKASDAMEAVNEFSGEFFNPDSFFFSRNTVFQKCLGLLNEVGQYSDNYRVYYPLFLQIIDSETYIDPARNGIRVYKYPVSAAMAADIHYVIGLDDKNTSVSFDKYPYLPVYLKDKNDLKGTVKTDDVFAVYTNCGGYGTVKLSGTKKGFDGSRLLPIVLKEVPDDSPTDDIFSEEIECWSGNNNLKSVSPVQQEGYLAAKNNILNFDSAGKFKTNLRNRKQEISASKLKDFCKCPYKGYVSIYLKPHQGDFEPKYLDRRVLGNILHQTIQSSLEEVQGFAKLNDEVLIKNLKKAVRDFASNHELGPAVYQNYIVEKYSRILPEITQAGKEEERQFLDNATLCSNESGAEGEFVFDSRIPDVTLHGRPDTILNYELSYVILDYKTTDNDKNRENNPQIALYAQIMESGNRETAAGAYYIIDDGKMQFVWPYRKNKNSDFTTWDKIKDKLVSQEKLLADSIIAGSFDFTEDSDDCDNCPYARICRRRYSVK